jgi:hypothetical protein
MCALVIGAFMGLWMGMGVDRLLKPGSWQGNTFLCIAAPAITVIGGLFGGWMCGKIGRGRGPVMALAADTLVVGLASTIFITLKKPFPADPREPGLTMEQIMEKGREPTWLAIFNPIAGAVMVVIGGMGAGKGRKAAD